MKTKGKTWSHGSNSCLSFVVWRKGGCCAELLDVLQTDRNIDLIKIFCNGTCKFKTLPTSG